MGNDIARRAGQNLGQFQSLSKAQLQLIRRTVAKDTSDDEFNMFIEICRLQNLNPFKRQIYALVYNKEKADKRQVVFITGIDGYRAIAKRTGTFRPADKEPEITTDPALIDPDSNPAGIVKAVVTVYQYGPDGVWYPVVGTAHWAEFAPLGYDYGDYNLEDRGEKWPDGNPKKTRVLKPNAKRKLTKDNWRNMPNLMIAKCAEANALRKGWPEEIGALYVQEEVDFMAAGDVTAAQAVEQQEIEERERKINTGRATPLVLEFGGNLQFIPNGQFSDKVLATLRGLDTAQDCQRWVDMNQMGLNQFWATNKSEALELKKQTESLIKSRSKAEVPDIETAAPKKQKSLPDKCERCGGRGIVEDADGKGPCPACGPTMLI